MRKRLIWLVISAAFIGPGTVTTATKAGAEHEYALLWTLLFAALACYMLQEGVGRIYISSGLTLSQAISKLLNGPIGMKISAWAVAAVVLGCAAYEAGNILGAVAGVSLFYGINQQMITLLIVLIVGLLLTLRKFSLLTNFLGVLIGVMGIGLMILVILLPSSPYEILEGLVVPTLPRGSALLALGLVGTTVVPYNLFLGSRLAKGQSLSQMRSGLLLAVVIGILISISLVIVGSKVNGSFSFEAVGITMSTQIGTYANMLFAFGLFAAGITSSLTAPWAAAESVSSIAPNKQRARWHLFSWMTVLGIGFIFGMLDVKPVPVIILAQAVNGFLLPFLAIAIMLILNKVSLMQDQINSKVENLLMLFVVWVSALLGEINLLKVIKVVTGRVDEFSNSDYLLITLVATGLVLLISFKLRKNNKT